MATSDPTIPPEEPLVGAIPRRSPAVRSSALAAAMLAVGAILEPQNSVVEITTEAAEPTDDLPFTLDFGDLPPLD